jgi:hypothetical protein
MCTHEACLLMQRSGLPIQEIANQCKEQIENEKPLLVSPKES